MSMGMFSSTKNRLVTLSDPYNDQNCLKLANFVFLAIFDMAISRQNVFFPIYRYYGMNDVYRYVFQHEKSIGETFISLK